MDMKDGIIEQLRSAVDSHHNDALRAIEVLEVYLRQCQVPALQHFAESAKKQSKTVLRGKRKGTNRERVMAALSVDRWQTVSEIAAITGMKEAGVRGVLYAPTRDQLGIETHRGDRGAEFRRKAG